METFNIFQIIYIILGLITIIGLTISMFYFQIQHYREVQSYCDTKYGEGNWELKETTGQGKNRYYIGQVWECVELNSTQMNTSVQENNENE